MGRKSAVEAEDVVVVPVPKLDAQSSEFAHAGALISKTASNRAAT